MHKILRRHGNVAWMAALAALLAFSVADVLFLSSCSAGAESEDTAESTQQEAPTQEGEAQQQPTSTDGASGQQSVQAGNTSGQESSANDYLFLVNRDEQNAIPDGWLESIDLVEVQNRLGETYTVERKAAEAYQAAEAELEQEGIYACLNSAYRSRAEQESIYADQAEQFGDDYAAAHVAPGGHSEHETGIAIDVILIVDGEELRSIEQMEAHPDELAELDRVMAEHGFILRYLEGKEDITGYDPELWHFRYLDDPAVAQDIMARGITLEEYLGRA